MKVLTNVKSKKKKVLAGPGDDKSKKEHEVGTSRNSKKYTDFRAEDKLGRNDREKANARSASTGTFASGGAAPRVGGKAEKATTVYTGKGALPGAKKLPKASTKRTVVVRRKRI